MLVSVRPGFSDFGLLGRRPWLENPSPFSPPYTPVPSVVVSGCVRSYLRWDASHPPVGVRFRPSGLRYGLAGCIRRSGS